MPKRRTGPLVVPQCSRFKRPFGNVTELTSVSIPGADSGPNISSDGLTLFFSSNRPGKRTTFRDIWVASRDSVNEPFRTPVNLDDFSLGSDINGLFSFWTRGFVASDWPAHGSKHYVTGINNYPESDLYEATWLVPSFADVDENNEIDRRDLDVLLGNYGKQPATLSDGNLDLNGRVDLGDFRQWKNNASDPSGAIVPEPNSLAMALAALVVASMSRVLRRNPRWRAQPLQSATRRLH